MKTTIPIYVRATFPLFIYLSKNPESVFVVVQLPIVFTYDAFSSICLCEFVVLLVYSFVYVRMEFRDQNTRFFIGKTRIQFVKR